MGWNEDFPRDVMPEFQQITNYIGSPLWMELCEWAERTYGVAPRIEHSTCSGAPGWNVKYRKAGRALCTLYPHKGYFTCLLAIGPAQAQEVELRLPAFSDALREQYLQTNPMNGTRWMMVDVKAPETLRDVQTIVDVRAKTKR